MGRRRRKEQPIEPKDLELVPIEYRDLTPEGRPAAVSLTPTGPGVLVLAFGQNPDDVHNVVVPDPWLWDTTSLNLYRARETDPEDLAPCDLSHQTLLDQWVRGLSHLILDGAHVDPDVLYHVWPKSQDQRWEQERRQVCQGLWSGARTINALPPEPASWPTPRIARIERPGGTYTGPTHPRVFLRQFTYRSLVVRLCEMTGAR